VPRPLNALSRLMRWRSGTSSAERLYGAIVAQARLPVFYRGVGVPDTVEGRFVLLSLHLFALLHRLKSEGAQALDLGQELMDRFAEDMETVLRQIGVSDLGLPRKVRGLATASQALLQGYDAALAEGEAVFAAVIAEALPLKGEPARAVSGRLTSYLMGLGAALAGAAFHAAPCRRGEPSTGYGIAMDRRRDATVMNDELKRSPLSRPLRVDEIAEGTEVAIEPTDSERAAIADMLDLCGLERLTVICRLRRRGGGRIGLSGRLEASVTQTCVISLAPVQATLDLPIEIEFWPVPLIDEFEKSVEDPSSPGGLDWPEPIVEGRIDLGSLVYETLATALDPYPKWEGVTFEWPNEAASDQGKSPQGPFAALERLKQR
jgi:hypothetical protein